VSLFNTSFLLCWSFVTSLGCTCGCFSHTNSWLIDCWNWIRQGGHWRR
jgi:hypothetical protein